jgi:hypothetical protein
MCPQEDILKTYKSIFKVQLTQQEGFLPCAKVLVPSEAQKQLAGNFFSLLERVGGQSYALLQRARIVSSIPQEQGCIELTLVPEPITATCQQALREKIRALAPADPLFCSVESENEPCQSYPVLIEYDRIKASCEVSDLLVPQEIKTLSPDHVFQNIKITQDKKPYAAVSLRVEAQWLQYQTHLADVGSALGEGGLIETLTPDQLFASWPQPGQSIGSGVVLQSNLHLQKKTMVPLFPLKGEENHGREEVPLVLKSIFQPELTIAWSRRVKCREQVTVTVRNMLKPEVGQGAIPTVNYSLRPAQETDFDGTADIFFPSIRGQKALEYAIAAARTRLMASNRCVRVTVPLTYEQGRLLSTCQWISLQHEWLPGGQVTGKVVSYVLEASFGQYTASVTLGVTIDTLMPQKCSGPFHLEDGLAEPRECPLPVRDVTVRYNAADQLAVLEKMPLANDLESLKIPTTQVVLDTNPAYAKSHTHTRVYEVTV